MRGTFSNYKMIECMRDHQTNWKKKKIIKSFVALYSSKNGNFRMTIQFFNFCAFYLSQKLMWSVMLLMLLASLYILLEVHFHIYYKCCLIIFLLRSTVDDKGLCFSSHDNSSREEYFWKQSVFPGCNPFIFSEIRRKKDGQ